MRVERWFAFVDLSGFTSFSDEHGDDESVRVLTEFRRAAREVATDFGVRIAKWLGDGCMFVAVDPAQLVAAVCRLEETVDEMKLPLSVHAGMAGGGVILLEGDDYTGGPVNLASRLTDIAGPHEIIASAELGRLAPDDVPVEPGGLLTISGLHHPVEVVRLGCSVDGAERHGRKRRHWRYPRSP